MTHPLLTGFFRLLPINGLLAAAVIHLIPALAVAADAKEPPKEFTNSIGMKFVLVPAGEFMMGSDETAEERAKDYPRIAERKDYDRLQPADEAPAHKVKI